MKARSWVVPIGSLLCACYPPTEDCRPPSAPPSEREIPLRSHLRMSHSISSQKQSRFSILVLNLLWTYFLSPIFFSHIPSDILLLFQNSLNFPGRTKEELFYFPWLGFYIYPEDSLVTPDITFYVHPMRQLQAVGNNEIVDSSKGTIFWSPLLIIRIPSKASYSCLFFFILHPLFKTLLFYIWFLFSWSPISPFLLFNPL